jgi:hypothetical protein
MPRRLLQRVVDPSDRPVAFGEIFRAEAERLDIDIDLDPQIDARRADQRREASEMMLGIGLRVADDDVPAAPAE